MRMLTSAVTGLVALVVGAVPAVAQTGNSAEAQKSQGASVTPYVGTGTAGAPPVGAAVTVPITSLLSVETDMAYRCGEGGINALSTNASLLFLLPKLGESAPYVAAGVGLSQYGVPLFSSSDGPPIGTQSRLAMTVNGGAGVTVPVKDKVGLRTDARWFKSFGTQGAEEFRVSQGISFRTRHR